MTERTSFKAAMADLARPFALYSVGASTGVAIVRLAWVGDDLSNGAVFIGAALGGLGVLYGAKAWENAKVGGQAAEVEKERAKATPPPAEALKPASTDSDDGELPPAERVKL